MYLLYLLPDANKLAVRTVSAVRERRETQPGTETEDQERGENTAGGSQSLDHLSAQTEYSDQVVSPQSPVHSVTAGKDKPLSGLYKFTAQLTGILKNLIINGV